jgi:glycosyltransferase involved in cell wall biosynthesis
MNSDKSKWHDAVIPPMAFESSEFEFSWKKGDYILFMSRLNEDKGLGIFLQLAEHFPERKFKLAGQGTLSQELPPNVEFLGYLGLEERKEYLKNAACVVTPTHYIEPFGLTAVEAAISGTPIITTNWGGYTDNVIHGVTGFRCSYFEDFVQAIKNIDKLDRNDCRGFGELFAAESLLGRWEEYLHNVQKDSWYEIS